MAEKPLRILIVEDEAAHAEAISRAFESSPMTVDIRVAGSLQEFRQISESDPPDIALIDLNLPDGRAFDALTAPAESGPFPILIMTSYGNERAAVESMRDGALDYIVKSPETFSAMPHSVERAMREWNLLKERKLSQEDKEKLAHQLNQAQKMESIGTLAGGVAHDFNNILSAIIGYGHMALMKMPADDPNRINIGNILEAAEKAALLTKDLLLFSRKQASDRRPVDLIEIIGRMEKFLIRIIGEDIEFRTALRERPMTVLADSHQIEQVLMNLATNARDAMPKGGLLTIEAARTDLDGGFVRAHGYGMPGSFAMITVSDTGVGMDDNTRQRIFEPFFTTKDTGKGTGLGLAVVYGIIKQHDGYINVYSEPAKGTTFRIYLPLIKNGVAEVMKDEEQDYPLGGTETILLAEDDLALRKLSSSVLSEFGYNVLVSNDGEEAVSVFNANRDSIQLLLFDLIMPKMTGKEACDAIRKIRPDVPVIFSSGYAPDIIRQRVELDDSANIIFKPVSPKDLLRKVREVLDRQN